MGRRRVFLLSAILLVLLLAGTWWVLRSVVAVGEPTAHIRGPVNGLATVTFYGDVGDRLSLDAYRELRLLTETFPLDLRFEYRHLSRRSFGRILDSRSRELACAGSFGKFWSYLGLALKASEQAWPGAEAAAQYLSIPVSQFRTCIGNRATAGAILADERDARSRGIEHAPAVLVDGRRWQRAIEFEGLRSFIIDSLITKNTREYRPELDAADLVERLSGVLPPVVLDVREPEQFARVHIRGSTNLPASSLKRLPDLLSRWQTTVRPEQTVVVVGSDTNAIVDTLRTDGLAVFRFENMEALARLPGAPVEGSE